METYGKNLATKASFHSHHKQFERQKEALNTFPIKINATKNNNSSHGKSKAKKWPIKQSNKKVPM
jgi:hypothetical protein